MSVAHSARRPRRDSGVRLGSALLAYMLGVTLMITLLPFQFEWPQDWRVLMSGPPLDVFANVLLFVPLGFLYRFTKPAEHRSSWLEVLALGAAVSGAIEVLQLFEATRETALPDVAANTVGALLGAFAFDRLTRSARGSGAIIGWLALELPLMGLVYLMVPLLWVNALASQGDWTHGLMTLLLGVFGSIILGGTQRRYFGPARAAAPLETASFAALWFIAGTFPTLPSHPTAIAASATIVAALCWWEGRRHLPASLANRRFEVPLLARAAPIYATYVALVVLAPLAEGVDPWQISFGFARSMSERSEILRFLELIAASTLVGYMAAEFRGRSARDFQDALAWVAGWGIALVVLVELARGYQPAQGASISRGVVLFLAVMFGGWLYYLQREHVVRLLAQRRAAPGTAASRVPGGPAAAAARSPQR